MALDGPMLLGGLVLWRCLLQPIGCSCLLLSPTLEMQLHAHQHGPQSTDDVFHGTGTFWQKFSGPALCK